MKNILLAVDSNRNSLKTIDTFLHFFNNCRPASITLLYVQKIEGDSIMDELLLSDSEMSTLRESLQGTEHQEKLDQQACKILKYYQKFLNDHHMEGASVVVREGHPAEEILNTAKEIKADLIVIGSRGKRLHNIFLGSVSREVANNATTSVLIIK